VDVFQGLIFFTLFLLAGLLWSFVFFSKKEIDWVERVAISFGLSIGMVTLGIFWLMWLFHVRLNPLSACLVAGGLVVIAGAFLVVRSPDLRKDWVDRLKDSFGSSANRHSRQ